MMKKFPISNFQKGFSLVEILATISLMAVMGSIIVGLIVFTIGGSKKSDTIEIVRKNGDIALSQMVKTIRYANNLSLPAACTPPVSASSISVTSSLDYSQTTLSCPQAAVTTITSNSASLIDTNAIIVNSCSFTCTQTTPNTPPTINIQFTLSSKSSNSFIENNATIPFQSSVTMRNFSR
jgi:prepilin-type N-terminal cleavage/methylation domain-containing protein